MNLDHSPGRAALLFAVVIFAWGINWSVTQVVVESIPPLWTTAIRCWVALIFLLPIQLARRELIVPKRGDVPVVLSIALLHMGAFSTLSAAGQQFVPASQAIVLGYTTPLWVAIAAPLALGERVTGWRALGILLSLGGLLVIFNPGTFDWSDRGAVVGCSLLLLGSVCWSASIVIVRAHRWLATPFQLLLWQVLVAGGALSLVALIFEGPLRIHWTWNLIFLCLYGGLVGTVLAYWAMSLVNRQLPAITTSLGVLLTPLVGMACASFFLGETVSSSLIIAAVLIVGGVALGTAVRRHG